MPNITPLGLARQTTMLACNVRDAVEMSRMLLEPDRGELLEEADLWSRQIRSWESYAEKEEWWTAQRHASTMGAMAEVIMLSVNIADGSSEGNRSPKSDKAGS